MAVGSSKLREMSFWMGLEMGPGTIVVACRGQGEKMLPGRFDQHRSTAMLGLAYWNMLNIYQQGFWDTISQTSETSEMNGNDALRWIESHI